MRRDSWGRKRGPLAQKIGIKEWIEMERRQ